MPSPTRLSWPDGAPVVPVEPLRAVIEAYSSLALRHPDEVSLLPTLVDEDGDADEAADPPPALEQIVEEFGGVAVCGRPLLDLLVDDRSDLGPYTLLGEPTTFYPLYEGEDVAVVLMIDEDGAPGAVYGIGEDLAMTLAARSIGHYLERFLHALTETLGELDAEVERTRGADAVHDTGARAEAAERLIDAHLLSTILGDLPEGERDVVPVESTDDSGFEEDDLPEGAVAVADLRDAPIDATVQVMDADLPGDPLECRIVPSHRGLVLAIVDDAQEDRS